jgi:hypothetical protein
MVPGRLASGTDNIVGSRSKVRSQIRGLLVPFAASIVVIGRGALLRSGSQGMGLLFWRKFFSGANGSVPGEEMICKSLFSGALYIFIIVVFLHYPSTSVGNKKKTREGILEMDRQHGWIICNSIV